MSLPLNPALSRRVVVLNGAAAGENASGLVAALEDGHIVAERRMVGRGAAERLAIFVNEVLDEAGWGDKPDAIVAVVGPGSFTGLRASLALAQGLAMGYGVRGLGVTAGDAQRAMPGLSRAMCVSVARRNRCFVDDGIHPVRASAPADIVVPPSVPAVTGDALAWLSGAQTGGARRVAYEEPTAEAIWKAACAGPVQPLEPIYVDPPEAKLPQQGLRPAPVG